MIDAELLDCPSPSLGPAMHFVLLVAAQRARTRAAWTGRAFRYGDPNGTPTALWDLVERHHPEELWLAQSHLRGERSLDELRRNGPRGGLAPCLLALERAQTEIAMWGRPTDLPVANHARGSGASELR